MEKPRSQSGAALLEFSIVAVVMLGILLPGMISVGKALSEIGAASQGAYMGAQEGAEVKIDFAEEATSVDIETLNLQVRDAVQGRVDTIYPLMAPRVYSSSVNNHNVSVFRPETGDTDHWMVQADMVARFSTILTSIPVTVKSVSTMLNVQPRRAGDLAVPQRIKRGKLMTVPAYKCDVTRCANDIEGHPECRRECCGGFIPGYEVVGGAPVNGILRNNSSWICPVSETYGPPGTGPGHGNGGDGVILE